MHFDRRARAQPGDDEDGATDKTLADSAVGADLFVALIGGRAGALGLFEAKSKPTEYRADSRPYHPVVGLPRDRWSHPYPSFDVSSKQPLERQPERLDAIRLVATEEEHRNGSGFVRTPGYIRDLPGDADKARVDALAGLLRSNMLIYGKTAGPRPLQQERTVCRLDVLRDR